MIIPDKPIAFNRDFVKLGIGVKGALFLSQAIYWSRRTKDKSGWFYKTIPDWEDETGLTTNEQRGVKNKLLERGFIKIEKRGTPAKNYFFVEESVISTALDELKQHHQCSENHTTSEVDLTALSYSENTTENTTESAEQSSAGFDPSGAEIIKAFEGVNPACKKYYGNKTQRAACDRLIETYGLDEVLRRIPHLKKTNQMKYVPTITTPLQLEEKWVQLHSALQRLKQDHDEIKNTVAFS